MRVLVVLGVGGVWAIACGGPQPLGAAGSVCFRADECQAGLACVPESMGAAKHVCSADLSGIVSMVDGAPPDGDLVDGTGGSAPLPEGGSPSIAGMTNSYAGKAAGGAPGGGGKAGTAGSPASAGAASGGSPAAGGSPASGGASTAGAPAAGTSNGGAENGGVGGG